MSTIKKLYSNMHAVLTATEKSNATAQYEDEFLNVVLITHTTNPEILATEGNNHTAMSTLSKGHAAAMLTSALMQVAKDGNGSTETNDGVAISVIGMLGIELTDEFVAEARKVIADGKEHAKAQAEQKIQSGPDEVGDEDPSAE